MARDTRENSAKARQARLGQRKWLNASPGRAELLPMVGLCFIHLLNTVVSSGIRPGEAEHIDTALCLLFRCQTVEALLGY